MDFSKLTNTLFTKKNESAEEKAPKQDKPDESNELAEIKRDYYEYYYNLKQALEERLRKTYEDVYERDGFFRVSKNREYGLYYKDGEMVLPCEYSWIKVIYRRFYIIEKTDKKDGSKKYGLLDTNSKKIFAPVEYDKIHLYFCFQLAQICLRKGDQRIVIKEDATEIPRITHNQRWTIFNRTFEKVMTSSNGEDAIAVYSNGEWKVIKDKDHSQYSLDSGLYPFCNKDNKCGIMHYPKGDIVIPAEYDDALVYKSCAKLRKNGKWGVVHMATGKVLIPFTIENRKDITAGAGYIHCKNVFYNARDGRFVSNEEIEDENLSRKIAADWEDEFTGGHGRSCGSTIQFEQETW